MQTRTALASCLIALLALAACNGPTAARNAAQQVEQEREVAALRARVERLEQGVAEDRARTAENLSALREDLTSLRASLEEASRHVAALTGQEPAAIPGPAASSPRAALRENLHKMLETTKRTLERLNQQLERSLSPAKTPEKTVPPPQ